MFSFQYFVRFFYSYLKSSIGASSDNLSHDTFFLRCCRFVKRWSNQKKMLVSFNPRQGQSGGQCSGSSSIYNTSDIFNSKASKSPSHRYVSLCIFINFSCTFTLFRFYINIFYVLKLPLEGNEGSKNGSYHHR